MHRNCSLQSGHKSRGPQSAPLSKRGPAQVGGTSGAGLVIQPLPLPVLYELSRHPGKALAGVCVFSRLVWLEVGEAPAGLGRTVILVLRLASPEKEESTLGLRAQRVGIEYWWLVRAEPPVPGLTDRTAWGAGGRERGVTRHLWTVLRGAPTDRT